MFIFYRSSTCPVAITHNSRAKPCGKRPGRSSARAKPAGASISERSERLPPGAKQRRAKPAGGVSEQSERKAKRASKASEFMVAVVVVCAGRTCRMARFAFAQAVATRAMRKARPEQAQRPQATNKKPHTYKVQGLAYSHGNSWIS